MKNSEDSWKNYLEPGPGYQIDQNSLRLHENRPDSWKVKGDSLKQNYNYVRESEKTVRDEEIFQRVKNYYLSRNGLIVLVISVVLCLITSTLSLEGLFFWNIILFMIVWGFHEITARTQVRSEWEEVQEEFDTF
jgi:hypothetical protein